MMPAIQQLIAEQKARETELADFVRTLDARRTASLIDLLTCSSKIKNLDIESWFNHAQFVRRIGSFCRFLGRVPSRPYIFFQASDEFEDELAHQQHIERHGEIYAASYAACGPKAWYFHTRTNFFSELNGSPKKSTCTIRPGYGYTDWLNRLPHRPIGYRLPNYCELLGISEAIATDYFARMIIHDLGHAALPMIGPEMEPLHDIAMIYAMGVNEGEIRYANEWEQAVHGECTSYLFSFMDGVKTLERLKAAPLSPLQEAFRSDLIKHFQKTTSPQNLRKLWGVTPNLKGNRLIRLIEGEILKMRDTGFERYAA